MSYETPTAAGTVTIVSEKDVDGKTALVAEDGSLWEKLPNGKHVAFNAAIQTPKLADLADVSDVEAETLLDEATAETEAPAETPPPENAPDPAPSPVVDPAPSPTEEAAS